MKFSQLYTKIFINTSSQVVAKALTIILSFLTVGLLTRYLGVEKYGIYTLVFAYLAFFGIFADFGLQQAIVRDFSGSLSSSDSQSVYFFIKIVLIAVSTMLALVAVLFFPYSASVKTAIAVGAFAVASGYMNGYGASVLQSKIQLDTVAILEVINRIISVSAIVLFVWLRLNIYAMLIAIFIGNAVTLAINIYLAPDYFRLKCVPSKSLIWSSLKTAFPIGITSLLAVLYFKIDTLMLSVMKGTTEVGIYSLSYKIFENIIMLWLFYLASIYPLMAGYVKTKSNDRLRSVVKNSTIIAIVFSFVVIVIGFITAPLVVGILGSKDFIESILPLRILLLALPFACINTLLYYLLLSVSQAKAIVLILVTSVFFNFVVNFLAIPTYSYMGTSAVTVITEMLLTIGYGFAVWKYKKLL